MRRRWSFAELHARSDAEAVQHTVQIGRIGSVLKLDEWETDASRAAEGIERRVRIAQIDKVLERLIEPVTLMNCGMTPFSVRMERKRIVPGQMLLP